MKKPHQPTDEETHHRGESFSWLSNSNVQPSKNKVRNYTNSPLQHTVYPPWILSPAPVQSVVECANAPIKAPIDSVYGFDSVSW